MNDANWETRIVFAEKGINNIAGRVDDLEERVDSIFDRVMPLKKEPESISVLCDPCTTVFRLLRGNRLVWELQAKPGKTRVLRLTEVDTGRVVYSCKLDD